MMAVGFILPGSLWAADGLVIVPYPATKAHCHPIKSCENSAIWDTLRAVRAYLRNVPAMR